VVVRMVRRRVAPDPVDDPGVGRRVLLVAHDHAEQSAVVAAKYLGEYRALLVGCVSPGHAINQ
jgi:hypothetical protein